MRKTLGLSHEHNDACPTSSGGATEEVRKEYLNYQLVSKSFEKFLSHVRYSCCTSSGGSLMNSDPCLEEINQHQRFVPLSEKLVDLSGCGNCALIFITVNRSMSVVQTCGSWLSSLHGFRTDYYFRKIIVSV